MDAVCVENQVEGLRKRSVKLHQFRIERVCSLKLVPVFLEKNFVQLSNPIRYGLDADFLGEVVSELGLELVGVYILDQLVHVQVVGVDSKMLARVYFILRHLIKALPPDAVAFQKPLNLRELRLKFPVFL